MATRSIRFAESCNRAAAVLGGYEAIDDSLYAHYDALHRRPEGFAKVTTEWGSIRYIHTVAIGAIPELTWHFVLETNGDVTLVHVELYD